jgi:hypothetical protein
MGRGGEVQSDLVMTWTELRRSPGQAFYNKLQNLLAEAGFDAFVETIYKRDYAPGMGRRHCRRAAGYRGATEIGA